MKRLSSLLLLCVWLVGGVMPLAAQETKPPPTGAPATPAERLRFLEAENKMLRAQIRSLQKELAEIRTEVKIQVGRLEAANARLRTHALWSVPIPIAKPSANGSSSKPATHVRRGRQLTPEWLEGQYQKFADTMVLVGGRFYKTGKSSLSTKPGIWKKPPPIGSLRWAKAESHFREATVIQVLSASAGLVELNIWGPRVPKYSGHRIIIHVRGLGPKWVDGLALPDVPLVYLGPHTYLSTAGARRTVQSYRVHCRLTRAEFARALAEGFELSEASKP